MLIGMAVPALGQQNVPRRDQQAVRDVAQRYMDANNRQDAAGVAALYTEDAIRVTPQGILHGRDAIRKETEDQFKAGGHDLSINFEVIQPSGSSLWSAGGWDAKIGNQSAHGYWANTVVREGDGFKIKYNMYNVTQPTSGQQSANK